MDVLPTAEKLALLQQRRESIKALVEETPPIQSIDNAHDLIFLHKARHLETELAWLDEVIATVVGATNEH